MSFRILDRRELKNEVEMDIHVCKDKEKGIATLKVYGPNPKKGCTLMVTKSKKNDIKFVKILATEVIKPLIDAFISGKGWNKLLENLETKKKDNKLSCKLCEKKFLTEATLSTNISKSIMKNRKISHHKT